MTTLTEHQEKLNELREFALNTCVPTVHVIDLLEQERELCAQLAETVGLGEPHTMPPYSVRDLIAQAIRNRGK